MNNQTKEVSWTKLLISDKLKEIENDVDVDTEELLLKFNNKATVNYEILNKLNKRREIIINKINEIKTYNFEKISSKSHETLMEPINKYCVYFPSILFSEYQSDETIKGGILLITDFFISNANIKIIKKWFDFNQYKILYKDNGTKVKLTIETKELSSDMLQIEYILIAKRIINSFCNNQLLVETFKSDIEKIEEIKLFFSAMYTYKLDLSSFKSLERIHTYNFRSRIDNVPNLKYLKIEEAGSSVVDRELTNENLRSLEEIDLSNNSIRELGNNKFKSFAKLKSLNLDCNRIEKIDEHTFNGLENLENLTILIKISVFTKINFKDNNLKNLNLTLYPLKACYWEPKWFENFKKLDKLDLAVYNYSDDRELTFDESYNLSLRFFPNPVELFEILKLLKYLTIKIQDLGHFGNVLEFERDRVSITLTTLRLDEIFCGNILLQHTYSEFVNQFRRFFTQKTSSDTYSNGSIIDPSRIKHLEFDHLDIEALNVYDSVESLKLKGVTFLDKSHSEILRYLKNEILNKLGKLKILEISNQIHLKAIDGDLFRKLSYLELLDLSDNKLASSENGSFDNLTNLKKLNLQNNNINKLDASLFKYLTKLKTLNLRNNNLESLDKDIFKSLNQIEYISLGLNKLKSVDGLFESLSSLLEVDIFQHDQIESIDMNQFIRLENLSKLGLNDIIKNDPRFQKDIEYLIKIKNVVINHHIYYGFLLLNLGS